MHLKCLEEWRPQLRRGGGPKSPFVQEPAVWIVSQSQFLYVYTGLYRIMILFDVVAIQSARRFRTVPIPDVLFYHHIDSFQPKANCPFVRLSATASYFKQTQRLYILRVPSASWFNKKQICCVWIWPNTSSRNQNCGTLHCLLKLWPKRNYVVFSNYVSSNIHVKFSRPSHVERLHRACAASYNEHPVYKKPVLTWQ
jgi:hypothetical protein